MLALPMNYKPSIVYGLTFLNILASDDSISWLAKDLLVLFYQETDYSLSIKEFLLQYYQLKNMPYLEGRTGYIRGGFALVVKDYLFNSLIISLESKNSLTVD